MLPTKPVVTKPVVTKPVVSKPVIAKPTPVVHTKATVTPTGTQVTARVVPKKTSPVKPVQQKVIHKEEPRIPTLGSSLSVQNLLDFNSQIGAQSNSQSKMTPKNGQTMIISNSISPQQVLAAQQVQHINGNGIQVGAVQQQRAPSFSVQQIIAPTTVNSHLIQTDPKFTGGLNFNQMSRSSQQQLQQQQQLLQQANLINSTLSSSALPNDLNLIEPTLPYSSSSQQLDAQQQLFVRQQQVKHNM